MQVSWIDADRIKTLVAQLAPQEPCAEESPPEMEIKATLASGEPWGMAADWMKLDELPSATDVTVSAPVEGGFESPQEEALERMEDEHDPEVHNSEAALPLSRIRDKLRAIRQRATEAGILTRVSEGASFENSLDAVIPAVKAVVDETTSVGEDKTEKEARMETMPASVRELPHTPTFEIPQGSRDERLSAFAGWARQVLHEDGGHVLVMSDDGEVLWGGEAKASLVLSTMMAWGAAIRASASSACDSPPVIRQPLASGNVLTVIPCETNNGMIHVAVAAPAGVSDELALVLRGALCAAMQSLGQAETVAVTA